VACNLIQHVIMMLNLMICVIVEQGIEKQGQVN